MDSSGFEGFHAQLNCNLTYGGKSQTQLTPVQYIKKIKTLQNNNNKKQKQTGTMKNIAKLA